MTASTCAPQVAHHHGEILPGHALTLRGTEREFGTSMTPAREDRPPPRGRGRACSLSSSGRVSTPELSTTASRKLAALRGLLGAGTAHRALPRAHFALIERLRAINEVAPTACPAAGRPPATSGSISNSTARSTRAPRPRRCSRCAETVCLQLGPTMAALYSKPAPVPEPPSGHRIILAALRCRRRSGLAPRRAHDVTQGLRMLRGRRSPSARSCRIGVGPRRRWKTGTLPPVAPRKPGSPASSRQRSVGPCRVGSRPERLAA